MGEPMDATNDDAVITASVDYESFNSQSLLNKFNQGNYSYLDIANQLKDLVPLLLCPTPTTFSLESSSRDECVRKALLKPLEDFICKFEQPDLNSYLCAIDNAPPVCGRLFKIGEPSYNCRQCAMDSTCVLCVECFINSNHRHHKYKMRTSSGGGCCDCGDEEAWKNDACCDVHKMSLLSLKTSHIPEDFINRARFIFSSVLQYAFNLLTVDYLTLPSELACQQEEGFDCCSDNYCTVLYNDEIHTFEQVINTLSRVIKCTQRDAIEYVTNIDREGRAIVKCSTFKTCSDLKSDIEKYTSRHGTKPLKVLVLQSKMIAHQTFAMKLLSWLQTLLKPSMRLRQLFSEVVTKKNNDSDLPFLEGILIRDSQLWKSARLNWHRLFITGMLMDYENKKTFATVFTRNYNLILNDFINDDHEHSFSVASLSVQIFTVPTLAHYLIEKEEVLFSIMSTFMSECSKKCNLMKKLEFERNVPNGKFKRAIYSLYDVRYLLSFVPTEFSDSMKKSVYFGFSLIINLLSYMQGMDSVTRQVGQHMEYEPEWESAFNLHIKLAPIITLVLKWCAADQYLTLRAYRLIINKLAEDARHPAYETVTVNSFVATTVVYDVATQPVSIHLPLSRFLAGLSVSMEKFGLSFSDFSPLNKAISWDPILLIEPVLRTRVMIAQVHAGMWRRNGYSLSNQIFFYNNVKCRGEMLDKDIILLQLGATLIPSHQFLLSMLSKFNLIAWSKSDFEKSPLKSTEDDSIRQTVHLVEEFLLLLITIIGERYVPGVGDITEADCLKREIIQQLCIKPLSHSELDKTLPDDINHETGMEDVIDDVAIFKRPTQGTSKGVYELKPKLAEKYNVFFYHYTREELSKSEENQRKYNKSTIGLECCPPPKLPPFTKTFKKVNELLTCDLMLYLIKIVLERCLNFCARSFSEPQVHKVLHLIGYALNEEENGQLFESFTTKASQKEVDIPGLLEKLLSNPRVEAHKDLIKWTIYKYISVSKKGVTDENNLPMECSNIEKEEKESRSRIAAERKAKIMAQMAAMQKNFMKDNAQFFEDEMMTSDGNEYSTIDVGSCSKKRVALGYFQCPVTVQARSYTCILCQEHQEVTADGQALVFAAFVQQSTVLCRDRNPDGLAAKVRLKEPVYNKFLSSNIGPGPHTSTCGHVMHRSCWRRYFDNLINKENRRPYRLRQPSSFDVEKREYLCPLCECLSNTVIPILPSMSLLPNLKNEESLKGITFCDWLKATSDALFENKDCKVSLVYSSSSGVLNNPSVSSSKTTELNSEYVIIISSSEEDEEDSHFAEESFNSDVSMHGISSQETLPAQPFEEMYNSPPVSENATSIQSSAATDSTVQEPTSSSPQVLRQYGSYNKVKNSRFEHSVSDDLMKKYEPVLSTDINEMVLFYARSVYSKSHGGVYPREDDPLVPLTAWQSCAYTIHTLEQFLRINNKPLFGDMSSRQRDCLEALVRLSGVLGAAWVDSSVINQQGSLLLEMIIDNKGDDPTLMDWDCFSLLITLTSCEPSMVNILPVPVPTGTILELNVFILMFYATVAQIMNAMDRVVQTDNSTVDGETECLLKHAQVISGLPHSDSQAMWEHIKSQSLPFLRCCVLYYCFLTDVPPPDEFTQIGGDTFENLCGYLGIPSSCKTLFDTISFSNLISKWADKLKNLDSQSLYQKQKLFKNLSSTNCLVSLPEDYSDLINTVSLFTCPNSDREDSRNPTMCLVCGEILCSQTYCCQTELNKSLVGACNFHAHSCGAGVGIFLRIRECEILLLSSPNRGSFISPPYLDEYGEPDPGLNRGNPLRLCLERYRRLQTMWLSHSIFEEISRSIETASSPVNTQWQHL